MSRPDEHDILDERPGRYYVSARNDAGAAVPLLGPFASHLEALDAVNRGRQLAEKVDPRACWYSYGTCRLHDDQPDLSPVFALASTPDRPVLDR